MHKVVIVGCGNVGMSYACSLVNGNSNIDELILIDINKTKAEGEAIDLMHASCCSRRKAIVRSGDYSECDNADIICIAAGRNQDKGETRMDLINKNLSVFTSIITEINKTKFKGIYLIATNPLDIMTYVTMKLSNFPASHIIGSGTTLDTARLKHLISTKLEINPSNINAYVIGEHGDSEMIPWSVATLGVSKLDKYLTKTDKKKIKNDVVNSAYEIINKKGNTAYGIGVCLKDITDAILENSNALFTLSVYDPKLKICIGQPAIVNRNGIKQILPLELNNEEKDEFRASVDKIKSVIKTIKL